MNKFELGKHINNFVKLNPKKNKFLKINHGWVTVYWTLIT